MNPLYFDENTSIGDLLDAYPWLIEELPAYDPRLKSLSNPAVRALARRFTVQDASRESGYTVEKLLDKLRRMIAEHQ